MQDGEPNLAATARSAVARMSAATAAEAGVADGGKVTVATGRGSVTVPVEVTALADRVVWLPTNSAGCAVRRELAAGHGTVVTVTAAGHAPAPRLEDAGADRHSPGTERSAR
jgi:NADH-quinone oxidoreductase subunit G